ncbi:Uncharacterised protein [Mycobacteroides abscessus subsp. bolletii]|nr:Uncharacterised protein [Mycobacteroides abscessus subsp. bolletii]SLD43403.1 Uncharacterised protein [Mycobacteroides abscessus subsp. bolletii]SLD72505.1 Uncharacterised protein [Mycobacteroides abscessus subsp. bolletii]
MRASAGEVTDLPAPAQRATRHLRDMSPGNLLARVSASLAPGPAVRPRLTDAGRWRINARCFADIDAAVLGCPTVEVRSDRARSPAELGALVAW